MNDVLCPKCYRPSRVNVETKKVICATCNEVFDISEIENLYIGKNIDLNAIPYNVWCQEKNDEISIGAKVPMFPIILMTFLILLSGGTGVSHIYSVDEIIDGILQIILGVIILVAAVYMFTLLVKLLRGKTVLTLNSEGGSVFLREGGKSSYNSFKWNEIDEVRLDRVDTKHTSIVFEGKKNIVVRGILSEEQRYYLFVTLKKIIHEKKWMDSKEEKEIKDEIVDFDINTPPEGTWYRNDTTEFTVGVSNRTIVRYPLLLFVIGATLFVGYEMYELWTAQVAGTLDDIIKMPYPVFAVVFLNWYLGVIFLTISAFVGKEEVKLNSRGGEVYFGIKGIGITRRFEWSEINEVKEVIYRRRRGRGYYRFLSFMGQKNITFARRLPLQRRRYMLNAIKHIITENKWMCTKE